MLFMLLLLPTRMVAQTTNDEPVTFTALEGNPEGVSEAENFKKLFDGKKTIDDFSKWCCKFSGSAYVIFEASKAGVPVGYTITTGNDNANWGCSGRNPLSWKLYGNNEGKNGVWTLIQEVENDDKLEDKNYTSYDFTCEGSTSYKYFKWEISAIHSGNTLQVGEFELKLNTCSHKNANGSDALGAVIETVDPTCAEHGYTTHECSLCHSTVKVYKDDELKAHTLTHHEATSDIKEHWQCDVCRKYFSDSNATQEVTYGSLLFDQAYAMFDDATETLTFSYGTKPEGAYALNQERPEPEWRMQKIRTVVFDASFAYARPTSCSHWFEDCIYLTRIKGIWNLKTKNVTDMSSMFLGCSSLRSLDLTNFDTGKVKDMLFMFYGCSALTTIYTSDKFVTDKVTDNGSKMFYGCKNLKGFIEYNKNTDKDKDNYKYANYKTGYFSKLVGKNGEEKIGATGETLTTNNLVLDDGKDFVAYEPFAAKAASYSRTMNAGTTWATLCLPFEVSLANQNFRAFKLLSADEGAETVELEEVKTIEAGTPVIIKMKDGVNSFSFSVENTAIAKDVQTAATADGNYQLQGLYTKKEFSKDADNNCYIVKGNKLMNPAKLLENTKVTRVASKPFRAYMVDNSSSAAGAKMFSIGFDDDSTTAIDSINTIANDKAEYYDLQGKRLNEPQKGINIVKRNGKTMKVIIK